MHLPLRLPPVPRRHWFYLDALKHRHGPLSDEQLAGVLRLHDCLVWSPGMLGWEWAGEYFARAEVAPLPGGGALPGTPPHRLEEALEALLGLIRDVLRDDAVSDGEVLALRDWLAAHPGLRERWPASALAARIARILEDGRVDAQERRELAALLARALGPEPAPPARAQDAAPAADAGAAVGVAGRVFAFAGRFVFGTRAACEAAVARRGGSTRAAPGPGVDYLVLGALEDGGEGAAAAAAAHALRAAGHPVAVVPEERWVAALG